MALKRVVVTGLGALTPIGNNLEEFWKGLIEGKSGAAPITYFDTEKFKTKFACELKDFDISDYLDRKQQRKTPRVFTLTNNIRYHVSFVAEISVSLFVGFPAVCLDPLGFRKVREAGSFHVSNFRPNPTTGVRVMTPNTKIVNEY